jgi:hypothetical protein
MFILFEATINLLNIECLLEWHSKAALIPKLNIEPRRYGIASGGDCNFADGSTGSNDFKVFE